MDGVASSPEKLDKYIRTIYNKANDMDRLIDELTFYSKIDTKQDPLYFLKDQRFTVFQGLCGRSRTGYGSQRY